VCSESKNCPRETPRRRKGWSSTLQVPNATLYNRVLATITQGQKSYCRIVRVRCKGGPIDNAVTGIPSAARAGTIEKHLDAAINARRDVLQATATARNLVQGKNCECGWDNPADRVPTQRNTCRATVAILRCHPRMCPGQPSFP